MSKILIHIGLHKTGTTFLQRQYFPHLKDCNYFANTSFFGKLTNRDDYKYHIISREELSGYPWNGQWKIGIANDHSWITSFENAIINLRSIFPQAHIVIVFRKHGDLLISLYKQYIQEGGVLSFKDFYDPNGNGIITNSDLNFEERLLLLKENFEQVTILSFEKFKSEGTEYINSFFESLGLECSSFLRAEQSNRSISGRKMEILRKVNKIYWKIPLKVRRILRKLRLSPRIILQSHLSFWEPKNPIELKEAKKDINLKFEEDWKVIENASW